MEIKELNQLHQKIRKSIFNNELFDIKELQSEIHIQFSQINFWILIYIDTCIDTIFSEIKKIKIDFSDETREVDLDFSVRLISGGDLIYINKNSVNEGEYLKNATPIEEFGDYFLFESSNSNRENSPKA